MASGWRAWVLTCTGGAELILAAGLCLITGRALPWLVSPALYGVLALSLGLLRPRLLRAGSNAACGSTADRPALAAGAAAVPGVP